MNEEEHHQNCGKDLVSEGCEKAIMDCCLSLLELL